MTNQLLMLNLMIIVLVGVSTGVCQKPVPLKFEIAAVNAETCLGDSNVNLRARITNMGRKLIVLDQDALTYAVSISTTRIEGDSIISSNRTDLNEDLKVSGGRYVILKPKKSIEIPFHQLLDHEFFIREGDYRIRATYGKFTEESYENLPVWRGSVNSNYVSIKLKNCSDRRDQN